MKKHILIALIIFAVASWGIYAMHFDETPLEQNAFIGYSMLVGVVAVLPVVVIIRFLVFCFGLANLIESHQGFFNVYFSFLPFFGGVFWSILYLLVIVVKNKIIKPAAGS